MFSKWSCLTLQAQEHTLRYSLPSTHTPFTDTLTHTSGALVILGHILLIFICGFKTAAYPSPVAGVMTHSRPAAESPAVHTSFDDR